MLPRIRQAINYIFNYSSPSNSKDTKKLYLNNELSQISTNNTDIVARKITNKECAEKLDHELYMQIVMGYVDSAKELIAQGASLKNYLNHKYDYHPLRIAIHALDIELLEFFLQEGFDPNAIIYHNNTGCPLSYTLGDLHLAFADENKLAQIVSMLIEYGADVNKNAGTKESPLALAIKWRHYDAFKVLLDNGAKINFNIENIYQSAEVHIALYYHGGRPLFTLELLCRGAIIKQDCGKTILGSFPFKSSECNTKIYDMLKQYGIKISDNIDHFQVTDNTKQYLKNKLFPVTKDEGKI